MGFKFLNNAPHSAYQALQVVKADRFIKKMEELQ